MKRTLFILAAIIFLHLGTRAQSPRYVIALRDKAATTFSLGNPSAFLSSRALERRTRFNIPVDSFDLPVPAAYIQQIQQIPGVTILNVSRWLNAVAVQVTDADALSAIQALPFVKSQTSVAARAYTGRTPLKIDLLPATNLSAKTQTGLQDYYTYGNAAYNEIHLHHGEFLHNIGLRGENMQIAMLDGGYYKYNSLKAFDSMNTNNRVLSTWDFVAHEASVAEDHYHGMICLSTMAANIPGQFIGKSPQASFHLFRTEETATEFPIEEFNWASGAERADSIGADVITASLGYGYGFSDPFNDYPYSDLNGDITMAAIAADRAAQKGLLVFCAAGNAGNSYWKMLMTPGDADSAVTVGAVNSAGVIGSFSSYGPTADGRIKPDVASVGVSAIIQNTNNTLGSANGTSLATPNMAGLATCLWQGFPEFSNMEIVKTLREAGNYYQNPGNQIGYGVPDMKKAFISLLTKFSTASVSGRFCRATINWQSKDVKAMKYEIEQRAPDETFFSKIGELAAKGGSTLAISNYSFEHNLKGVKKGLVQFRIRQIIDTAAGEINEAYIDTVSLLLESSCDFTPPVVRLAPNIVSGKTYLLIDHNESMTGIHVVLYDMKGAKFWEKTLSKQAGLFSEEINLSHLAKGHYILKAWHGQQELGTASLLKL